MLASCAPVNNITKDKNDKTDTADPIKISIELKKEQESVKLKKKN